MTAITTIKPRAIETTGDYVVNSLSSTGNVNAGNIRTDHLLYANGTAYVFTTNAAGQNTQIQFNDGSNFAGDANLTFNKTTGTLTVAYLSGNGANVTDVNALTLNGHSDTYFATSTQGNLADSAVQPGDLATVATTGNYSDLNGKPTLFDGEYSSLANTPTLFSGSYVDLTNKPTLGTAAATDANAYATAAQGTKADTALQAADLSGYATETYVNDGIANLVNSAPAALDTLNELAIALGNDASYSTTITNALANKLSTSSFSSTANTWIATQSTSNLSEGTNLYYTVDRANTAIDNKVTKSFVDNLGINATSLNGFTSSNFATSDQGNLADSAVQPGDLSNVATTGNYSDLNGKPTLFDGEYDSLANKPTLFSGSYTDLTNKPSLSTVATTGNYSDLSNKPTLFDGEYASLANIPTFSTVATSGNYSDLNGKPTLFSGSYVDLTNKPTLGTAAATDANAYATAAQGTLADSAVQPGANISVLTNDSGYLVAANLSTYATQTDVSNAVANLVASAPAALDTLNELANALANDANYSTTITNALADKLSTNAFSSTANTWIATQSTSNVTEGTNQYYTVARANTAIDNRVTKTFVDNLAVVANIANIAYSVDAANVSGQVSNALVAGTVYTNAQPNITSVGTLTSLEVTGNVTVGNISGANAISGNYFIGNGSLLTGLPASYANTDVANYLPTYTGDFSPGNITIDSGNLKLTGGSANYLLTTDGSGNLSWVERTPTPILPEVTTDSFTANGSQNTFTLTNTPNNISYTIVHLDGVYQDTNTYSLTGNVISFLDNIPTDSVVEVRTLVQGSTSTTGFATTAGTVTTNAQPNITSVGTLTGLSISGDIIPTANVTYSLGNNTNRFKDLFLSGSTINLGGATIKTDATSGAIALVPQPTANVPNPTALVISNTGAVSTVTTSAGAITSSTIANAAANSTVITTYGTISLSQPGNITAPFTGVARCYPTSNVTIVNIFASLGTASSSSFGFTLKKNGSNVANGTISSSSYRMTPVSANISVSTTDYLTLDVTSGTSATDLKVDLQYKLQ